MRTLTDASIPRRPQRSLWSLVAAMLLLGGCSKDPAAPIFESGPFAGTWQGSVVVTTSPAVPAARGAAGGKGSAVLDLQAASQNHLDGAVVMRWPGLSDEVSGQVGGTAAGSNLALSTTGGGHSVTLQLSRLDPTHLSGTFTANVGQGAAGTIELELVPVAGLQSQTFGLAHDGTDLWSLHRPTQTLYRITEAGAVIDSVRVANPDLVHLEWDGSHFWSMGWFIPLLWKIALTGETVAVYRLPTDLLFPTGLAFDGQYLYCAQSDFSETRIVRLSASTPVP